MVVTKDVDAAEDAKEDAVEYAVEEVEVGAAG